MGRAERGACRASVRDTQTHESDGYHDSLWYTEFRGSVVGSAPMGRAERGACKASVRDTRTRKSDGYHDSLWYKEFRESVVGSAPMGRADRWGLQSKREGYVRVTVTAHHHGTKWSGMSSSGLCADREGRGGGLQSNRE